MECRQAAWLHAALAHALVGAWRFCPISHQVLQGELDDWRRRPATTQEDFFLEVAQRMRLFGAEQAVLDALTVVEAAEAHLEGMFGLVLVEARTLYETHADWTADDVTLQVRVTQNKPYPDEAGFGELGAAACIPSTSGRTQEVELTLVPDWLGPPSWASVPYLLCHELVCHASQAVKPESTDPFTEGWMDLVALRLHDRWVDRIFPWDPSFAKESGRRLADILKSRGPKLGEPHMTSRAARGTGWAAAEWLQEMLRPFASGDGEAWCLFERLSVQLNRVPATPAVHESFVAAVGRCRQDLALRSRLLGVLRHWLAGGATAAEVFSFR